MNLKPEITIVGLFIIFIILIFGYEFTGNETFNILLAMYLFIIIMILLAHVLIKILKIPKKEVKKNFRNMNIITKILFAITIASMICSIAFPYLLNFTSILIFLLMITIFGEWFFKKNEKD